MAKYLNITLKIILVGLLAHAFFYPELEQYQLKGMEYRLVFYPIAVFAPFIGVKLYNKLKNEKIKHPHSIDLLITIAATLDMAGNTANFYNTIVWWDDFMHLVNSTPWVLVGGMTLHKIKPKFTKFAVASFTVAYGMISHVVWEFLEYLTFIQQNPLEKPTAHEDTVFDLMLATVGTLVGAWIMVTLLWNRSKKAKR